MCPFLRPTSASALLSDMNPYIASWRYPQEIRALLQWKMFLKPTKQVSDPKHLEFTGYGRPGMRICWELLESTSPLSAIMIKDLDRDLGRAVAVLRLISRILCIIRDDTSLDPRLKKGLLRRFYEELHQSNDSLDFSGAEHEDSLLVKALSSVIEEFQGLHSRYREIISQTVREMGDGMGDYVADDIVADGPNVSTFDDLDLYCHYAAGLASQGLTQLFVASGQEDTSIGQELELSNHVGLLLQKTQMIRRFRRDLDRRCCRWPREIWQQHGFSSLDELYEPHHRAAALRVSHALIADALRHIPFCLEYLSSLKNPRIFAMMAAPQLIAVTTLRLCAQNSDVFQRDIELREGHAIMVIQNVNNACDAAVAMDQELQRIRRKVPSSDPSHLAISATAAEVMRWREIHYPSCIKISKGRVMIDASDPRSQMWGDLAFVRDGLDLTTKPTENENQSLEREDYIFLAWVVAVIVMLTAVAVGVIYIGFYMLD